MTTAAPAARRGFTMVEILVVVVIIGVLAALIVPRFFGRIGKARQSVAAQQISEIEKVVHTFRLDYERYPESLDELVERPGDVPEEKWEPPALKRKNLIDPWGRPYLYKYPGDHSDTYFDLCTLGKDGQEGGEGEDADVVNW